MEENSIIIILYVIILYMYSEFTHRLCRYVTYKHYASIKMWKRILLLIYYMLLYICIYIYVQVLKKIFDLDSRKFSRNIELSTFSESMNAGVTVDSNLIWSPKSFLPRSASLNLTVDVFGESLNLLEVGGRAEGLEGMLEKLFGPSKDINNPLGLVRRKRFTHKPTNMGPLHEKVSLSIVRGDFG